MPTTIKSPLSHTSSHAQSHAQREDSFFARPVSRWFSVLLFMATSLGLVWVFGQNPTLEYALKACLFTVPATAYMLYRSFILHE